MKCSIVGCDNETMKSSKVECCIDHEQEVIEHYEEEYRIQQAELYSDWRSSQ